MRILGIDAALNHAGFVLLNERAEIDRYLVVTDAAGAAKRGGSRSILFKKSKSADRQIVQLERLQWWDAFLTKLIGEWKPTHVVIEDYAMRAESNAAYQIGEQGALTRLTALYSSCFLRTHDPLTVKMFGTGNGFATGKEVADVASERWKLDFKDLNPPQIPGKNQNTVPEEDLCAAYVLARMGWTEVELRAGRLALSSLDVKQVQAFNRVTKAYPVSLLGREWLTKAV